MPFDPSLNYRPGGRSPARLALLEEGGHALLPVLRPEAAMERLQLLVVAAGVARRAEQRLDLAQRVRALLRERAGDLVDPGVEVVHDELDEPPRLGLAGRDRARRT